MKPLPKLLTITDVLSSYIVTGPQCNFPYVTTGVARHTSPSSSPETQIESGRKASLVVETRKYRKRKRSHTYNKCKRTSMDNWIKRKKIDLMNENNIDSTIESKEPKKRKRTKKKKGLVGATNSNILLLKCQKCRIILTRCNLPQSNETKLARVAPRLSYNEDMTLKEIIEAKERMLSVNVNFENSLPKSNNLDGALRVKIQNYVPPLAVASNDLISRAFGNKETVKSSKKSKSKSVIKSMNKKSVERVKSPSKKAKKQSNDSIPSSSKKSAVKVSENIKLRDCFVLLENLQAVSCSSKANSPKKPQRRKKPMTKHCSTSDANFRLPTKSPQEYQFKRSFEKIPVYEKDSTIQFCEVIFRPSAQLKNST